MTHRNPYVQTLLEKGYTERECYVPAKEYNYPRKVHGRIFNTKEEYDAALADFLNGM